MHIPHEVRTWPAGVYAVLVFVTLLPLYYTSYRYRLQHPYGRTIESDEEHVVLTPEDFIRDWLSVDVIEPYNPGPLSLYCNQTEWNSKLVFNLDDANGGLGNVRTNILDFIFFAIEAGASIVVPGMANRSPDNLSDLFQSRTTFDALFDEEWFLEALGQACPKMRVYKPEESAKLGPALPGRYTPRTRRMDGGFENTKKAYLEHLNDWLKSNPDYKPDELTLVNTERTLWDIDVRALPNGLRRNFGNLLRLNPTARKLAAVAVQNLAFEHELEIDPLDAIPPHAFYGAHLRTESDAAVAGWFNEPNTNFSGQTDAYLEQALKHDLRFIYAASGSATDLQLFKLKAAENVPPVKVVTKTDLLPLHEGKILSAMTWDQQALVDYEVLNRCSVFGGFVKSSFSYNIGLVRNQYLVDQGRVNDPWRVKDAEEGVAFDDGLSRILGRDPWHEQRIPRGMWP